MQPFTLCLHCNLRVLPVSGDAIMGCVPERIAGRYESFARCPGCDRVYWEDSHWARMRAILDAALAPRG